MTDKDFHSLTDTNTVNDHPWKRVATCYSAVDRFFPVCGMFDLTEGIYHGNATSNNSFANLICVFISAANYFKIRVK